MKTTAMMVIFLSSQPGTKSNELSKSVTKQIVKTTGKATVQNSYVKPRKNITDKLNNFVKKYAYGGMYLVLGILVINAFMLSGINGYKAFIFFNILHPFCCKRRVSSVVCQRKRS